MKKLLLMMLVLMGGVMQVSADNYLKGSWDNWNTSAHKFVYDSKGYGSVSVTLEANRTYEFKITDSYNGDYSYNGDAAQITSTNCINWTLYTNNNNSKIITTEAGVYTFKIYWDNGACKVSVVYPTAQQHVVHFKNTNNWSSVYSYRYWDTTSWYDVKWPGSELSENPNNLGYYDVTFKDSFNRIIFSDNGDGTNKSGNVAIDFSSTEYWVTDNATATTTAPANWVGHTRTVTNGNYGTICLPYAATISGATIFKIQNKIMDGDNNLKGINIESVTGNAIEAGKAYIFKATGTTLTATYTGGSPSAATEAYGMLGNLSSEKVTVPSGKYIIKDNKIYNAGTNVTCGQYKGYITLEGLNETNARSANFINFEDTTTGIANLNVNDNANFNADAPMYNLAGQRVGKNYKGVVIVNGKKMLNK